jgi:hypothetical protein
VYVLSAKSERSNISVATWGSYDFEDFTVFKILKYFLHTLGLTTITKNKIFRITKLPPPMKRGEGYEER